MESTDARTVPAARSRRRRYVIGGACLGVAVVAATGTKLWLDHRVPGPDADPARLSRYMASPAFAALSEAQKRPYLEAFAHAAHAGQLTPEQQTAAGLNLMREPAKSPIQDYFALPPGQERDKFLDHVIDQQARIQGQLKPPPPDSKDGKGIRLQGPGFLESMSPEDRAQMDQFMQDLHDRRKARGLPDNGTVLFTR